MLAKLVFYLWPCQLQCKILTVIRCGVMYHMVRHPQAIITDLAPAAISGTVVAANERKRIGRLHSAYSAVHRVVQ